MASMSVVASVPKARKRLQPQSTCDTASACAPTVQRSLLHASLFCSLLHVSFGFGLFGLAWKTFDEPSSRSTRIKTVSHSHVMETNNNSNSGVYFI